MPKHGPPTKKCADCDHFLPLDQFSKSLRAKDKLCTYCKGCSSKHYKRYEEAMKARTKLLVTEKMCYRCRQTKHSDEFHICRSHKDNLANFCKVCSSTSHKEWAAKYDNAARRRARLAKHMYGIEYDELRRLTEAQGNICPICDKDMGHRPCIDHDHTTGMVRELLCNRCNGILAPLEDPIFMARATAYLQKHAAIAKSKIAEQEQVEMRFVL